MEKEKGFSERCIATVFLKCKIGITVISFPEGVQKIVEYNFEVMKEFGI